MAPLTRLIELIDKCVGSRIWVVMKGDKGQQKFNVDKETGPAY
jgi:hypothetical protein